MHAPERNDSVEAVRLLLALRTAFSTNDANHDRLEEQATTALARVPSPSPEQRSDLLDDCTAGEECRVVMARRWREHEAALDEFVACARSVLGVPDQEAHSPRSSWHGADPHLAVNGEAAYDWARRLGHDMATRLLDRFTTLHGPAAGTETN
ncbi:hypothetical protein ACPB9E_10325 [Streptomyces exfoliatus]|uniref:hypothetical protein n=1 Tax=Streptomyces exfoliatus TaxID=1905 RepID=UPI003C305B29